MSEHRLDRIVIERPRSGWKISSRKLPGYKKAMYKLTQEAAEDGLLRPYLLKNRWRSRYFSDHLSPLYGWLRSRVGQPWDRVYSQLCQKLDNRTLSGRHIFSHVWNYVERYAIIIDGVPYARDRQMLPLWRGGWRSRPQLYVHPETGVLCAASRPVATQPRPNQQIVIVDRDHQYRQLDSIWYFVSFQMLTWKEKGFDILCQSTLDYWTGRREYGEPMYAFHKRHATKKEIKKIEKAMQGIEG